MCDSIRGSDRAIRRCEYYMYFTRDKDKIKKLEHFGLHDQLHETAAFEAWSSDSYPSLPFTFAMKYSSIAFWLYFQPFRIWHQEIARLLQLGFQDSLGLSVEPLTEPDVHIGHRLFELNSDSELFVQSEQSQQPLYPEVHYILFCSTVSL